MNELSVIQNISIWALPVLFAITVHEVAHGWVARRYGDPTAYMLGRLTLNPIKHIDPVGTVAVPLVLVVLGGFVFGWAKPVPVTWQNLRNPKRDIALVALAGPASNLIMALIWALVIKVGIFAIAVSPSAAQWLIYMGEAGIRINLVLMVLNLLPIPPLDGGRVATSLLPGPIAYQFSRIEPFGIFILLGLLFLGVFEIVIGPVVFGLEKIIFAIF